MTNETLRLVKFQDPIFNTVQGEGSLVGVPSTFLRLHGCDFHCGFASKAGVELGPGFTCDTKESWVSGSEFEEIPVGEARKRISALGLGHLVITGGNPMLQGSALLELLSVAPYLGRHVTMETQGSVFHHVLRHVDLLSLSPKLHAPESWETVRKCIEMPARRLTRFGTQLKIVVSTELDVTKAVELAKNLIPPRLRRKVMVYLQPDSYAGRAFVRDVCNAVLGDPTLGFGLDLRVLPQTHKTSLLMP